MKNKVLILLLLGLVSCGSDDNQNKLLVDENKKLKLEVDSLKQELNAAIYNEGFKYPKILFQENESYLGQHDEGMLYCDIYATSKLFDKKITYSVYFENNEVMRDSTTAKEHNIKLNVPTKSKGVYTIKGEVKYKCYKRFADDCEITAPFSHTYEVKK